MWTEGQLGYLAGIIDGEGSIYIQRRMDNGTWCYWARFQISNTNKNLMNWIHETFGGLLYEKDRSKHNPKWKVQYEWYSQISLMDKLLPLVYPFLINKKTHAEIMMEFRRTFVTKTNKKLSNEVQCFREKCMSKIKHLNSR
jgi:hypothetical protein